MPICCLDAAHNSDLIDSGAMGNGLLEQDITLDIALRLKPLLEENGIQVVMTRTSGRVPGGYTTVNGSLQARCDISDNAKADLFVSIHVNAGKGTGSEVWVLSLGGRAEKAARAILARLIESSGWVDRGVKTSKLYVLANTEAPAILTENGFIDTISDAVKLSSPGFRQEIAVAHARGICDYFGIVYGGSVAEVKPTKGPIAPDDVYLSVRVRESLVPQAIKDINKLGFAAKRMELA